VVDQPLGEGAPVVRVLVYHLHRRPRRLADRAVVELAPEQEQGAQRQKGREKAG